MKKLIVLIFTFYFSICFSQETITIKNYHNNTVYVALVNSFNEIVATTRVDAKTELNWEVSTYIVEKNIYYTDYEPIDYLDYTKKAFNLGGDVFEIKNNSSYEGSSTSGPYSNPKTIIDNSASVLSEEMEKVAKAIEQNKSSNNKPKKETSKANVALNAIAFFSILILTYLLSAG